MRKSNSTMQNIIVVVILATTTLSLVTCESTYSIHGDIRSFIKEPSKSSSYLSNSHDDVTIPKDIDLKSITKGYKQMKYGSTPKKNCTLNFYFFQKLI